MMNSKTMMVQQKRMWQDYARAIARAGYRNFLEGKITIQAQVGFDIVDADLNPSNFGHQNASVKWALNRGRALLAMSFGLGKTRMQCEISKIIHIRTSEKVLLVCPSGLSISSRKKTAQ